MPSDRCMSSAAPLAPILALLFALAPPVARAQAPEAPAPETLRLDFAIEDPGLASSAGSRAKIIADSLASLFTRTFHFWSFRAGPSADSAACRVTLLGENAENLRLEILDYKGSPIGAAWDCEFRGAFDPNPLPSWKSGMPLKLPHALDARLLSALPDTLLALLARSHPVAVLRATRLPAEPLCVLPLPFSRFEVIAGSSFMLAGTSEALGRVIIRSAGTGQPQAWGNPPLFRGLSVRHLFWVSLGASEPIDAHLLQLSQLENVKILIEHVVRNPLAGMFDDDAEVQP